jgi:hypothetical protein
MKIFALLLLITASSFAVEKEIRDCAVTNIPTTYAGAGAIALSGIRTRGFVAFNDSPVDIMLCFTDGAAGTCTDHFPLPAGATASQELYPIAGKLYVRAVGSACTTGQVFVAAGISQ